MPVDAPVGLARGLFGADRGVGDSRPTLSNSAKPGELVQPPQLSPGRKTEMTGVLGFAWHTPIGYMTRSEPRYCDTHAHGRKRWGPDMR